MINACQFVYLIHCIVLVKRLEMKSNRFVRFTNVPCQFKGNQWHPLFNFSRETWPKISVEIICFCVGFPTLCQRPRNLFLYLFVHEREVLVTWFLFAFSEPWRLDSSRRFFIVYCTAAISLLSRWVLENLFGISCLFLGEGGGAWNWARNDVLWQAVQ